MFITFVTLSCDLFSQCVRLDDRGEAYGHYIMSFEALGPSLAEELELRNYNPFSMRRIRTFGKDILVAIAFMHRYRHNSQNE